MKRVIVLSVFCLLLAGCFPQDAPDHAERVNKSFRCAFAGECDTP